MEKLMPFNTPRTDQPRETSFPQLKPLSSETAKVAQRKAVESRMLNKEIREQFKRNAKAFQDVLEDIPDFSPLEVIKMCIHLALQDNNYEDAARWAEKLAEYRAPKLARVEVTNRDSTKDLSDEDLQKIINEENLSSADETSVPKD